PPRIMRLVARVLEIDLRPTEAQGTVLQLHTRLSQGLVRNREGGLRPQGRSMAQGTRGLVDEVDGLKIDRRLEDAQLGACEASVGRTKVVLPTPLVGVVLAVGRLHRRVLDVQYRGARPPPQLPQD